MEKIIQKLDKIGAVASLGCAIHCAILPLLVAVIPAIFLQHSGIEKIFLSTSLVIATFTLYLGHKKHGKKALFLLHFLALTIFYMAFKISDERVHTTLMVVGGLSLGCAHLLNRRLCNSCKSCCSSQE